MSKIQFQHSPFKLILLIYVLLAFLFAGIYSLPLGHTESLSFMDAFFLSASAISVTGLSTVNISESLTLFGQWVLLLEVQIGGIGIMVILGSFIILFKQNLSLPQQTLMSLDQNQKSLKSIKNLVLFVFLFAFIVEFFGFLLFFPVIKETTPSMSYAAFLSLFHAVTSFTNSGFDLFGDSLHSFSTNAQMVLGTAFLIFIGGLGFPLIYELLFSKGKKKSLFFKVNLFVHAALILFGFLFFFIMEYKGSFARFSLVDKTLNSLFLSITSRNGGVTTIDIGVISEGSLYILLFLMFIGASASSCGGGIRTSTFGVLIAKMFSIIKGREEVVLFKKSLHEEDVNKSFVIFFFFGFLFFFSSVFLSIIEPIPMAHLSFEVMSALSTTGLSIGITEQLQGVSKIWLCLLMLIGRVGVLVLIHSIIKPKKSSVKYVKEHIIVG